jgi:hypothetical protein
LSLVTRDPNGTFTSTKSPFTINPSNGIFTTKIWLGGSSAFNTADVTIRTTQVGGLQYVC